MLQKNNYAIKFLLSASLFVSSGLSHAAAMHKVKQSSIFVLSKIKLSDKAFDVHNALNHGSYQVFIAETGRINKKAIFVPERVGDISVYYDDSEFRVESQSGTYPIQSHFVDKELRGISKKDLAKLIATGSYLSVNKMEGENEYILKLNHRLNGGGAVGASVGTIGGAAAVQFVYNGTLGGIGFLLSPFLTPVGAAGVVGTIRFFTAPAALVATKVGAVAGGIAGGALTGPF